MMLDTIRELCKCRKIKWSVHTVARIQERGIDRADILHCLEKGEVIEEYPKDFPNPSCLVFGYTLKQKVLHVVAGCDGENVYIITAYYPNTDKFEADLKTRKEK